MSDATAHKRALKHSQVNDQKYEAIKGEKRTGLPTTWFGVSAEFTSQLEPHESKSRVGVCRTRWLRCCTRHAYPLGPWGPSHNNEVASTGQPTIQPTELALYTERLQRCPAAMLLSSLSGLACQAKPCRAEIAAQRACLGQASFFVVPGTYGGCHGDSLIAAAKNERSFGSRSAIVVG
ncbi:hypothetical protein MRX96_051563 [Rhipicephalus microplus]